MLDRPNLKNNNQANNSDKPDGRASQSSYVSPSPAVTLPKGGGAIKGIGEKFAANPVTGTGSMTVPIATTPGRSGFDPQLALSYDSGAGNGIFGLGWNLSLPSITRKTDKGLPRYWDGSESDVFILSGAEDLVPILVQDDRGKWETESIPPRKVQGKTYKIQRYRPRIEGLFARIERWTNQNDSQETFWRSISKDNVTTWYGRENNSRIFDPQNPTRIFSWLICESYDDKGNVIVYRYKEEDSSQVKLSQAHERNRTDESRSINRYLKYIRYGNHKPYHPKLLPNELWPIPPGTTVSDGSNDWFFEVVFDYGEHDLKNPKPSDLGQWDYRPDPFSSYRAGFEVRTYRLCQRVLMFHHFPDEEGVDKDCLVRSTDFTYTYEQNPKDVRNPIYSQLASVTQTGYKQNPEGAYIQKSFPPLEFTYSKAEIDETVHEIDPSSLENLPVGLDGRRYQWVDLDGEGLSGILTEQGSGWFYKRNLSPNNIVKRDDIEQVEAQFAPLELVFSQPNTTLANRAQFLDLAGDGQLDLVTLRSPTSGFYERTHDQDWESFVAFKSLPVVDWDNPNLKFIDLNGDGHSDILISEDDCFVWHPSLAEDGFGAAERVSQPWDEEKGPRVIFADSRQSIFLADLSGDGLSDIVRIRNGEVCYWPNLGCGRFGAKVTMDNSPWFDAPDIFDRRRIQLADIDGSGTTDILYLSGAGVQIYFNQSGNSWSKVYTISDFPAIDSLASVAAFDLLGNGTACLVWSSPLPGNASRAMRYIDLMGGQKPHLLIETKNNLGAETNVHYAPSTKFYLQDKLAGQPWITKLPFPVHVVERVDTCDRITENRFVSIYTYHHGYFDGEEREFRGFGMVEQWDTEAYAELAKGNLFPAGKNEEASSHVPPVHTKTWFHTGFYRDREHISQLFSEEYYQGDDQAVQLQDTILPFGLTVQEEREACRALKGSILRQEVYALDGTDEAEHPYTVTESNYEIRRVQPREDERHAVFFVQPRESLAYHYERNPIDPRISHEMTLEVDGFGNVLKSVAIAYGRRKVIQVVNERGEVKEIPNPKLNQLSAEDQKRQTDILIAYTDNQVTNKPNDRPKAPDWYRIGLPVETRTYEITGVTVPTNGFLTLKDFYQVDKNGKISGYCTASEIEYEVIATGTTPQKRLIEQVRTLYRANSEAYGLDPNGYKLNLIPPEQDIPTTGKNVVIVGKIGAFYHVRIFDRAGKQVVDKGNGEFLPGAALVQQLEAARRNPPINDLKRELIQKVTASIGYTQPNPLLLGEVDSLALPYESYKLAFTDGLLKQVYGKKTDLNQLKTLLSQKQGDGGGYVQQDKGWWIPSGWQRFDPSKFYLPVESRDPFGQSFTMDYDAYVLLVEKTEDPLKNVVQILNNYRVMQPQQITDPNGNRSAVRFDALGMVVGTAVMGKETSSESEDEPEGDSFGKFKADLTTTEIDDFLADPLGKATKRLGTATTRIIYDLERYRNSDQPVYAATLARETHVSDPLPTDGLKVQVSFLYSDGFGRELQTKIQAEPGPAPLRDANGVLKCNQNLVQTNTRWVGTGRTIYNNKGKPVKQYEPFFSPTHAYEDEPDMVKCGVTPILFYDPLERVVATLHPNHTYEKVVFDPWQQETWDVNDTVIQTEPKREPKKFPTDDPDVGHFFEVLPKSDYLEVFEERDGNKEYLTWYQARIKGKHGLAEKTAAQKAEKHAGTPTVAHFDTLGRTFKTLAHNRFERDGATVEGKYPTWVVLDIESNQREVRDERTNNQAKLEQRVVMSYDYDLLGNPIHQASMEAGERWMLNDVSGNPIRTWDSRGHTFRTEYDGLRRPVATRVVGGDIQDEILFEKTEYGEGQNQDKELNLRTEVFRQWDGAGIVTNAAYDFKGNLLRSNRQLVKEYKKAPDWSKNLTMEDEIFESRTVYDALNRPIQMVAPHDIKKETIKTDVIQPVYNEANLLEQINVWLKHLGEPDTLLDKQTANLPAVKNIDYNAKGQRELIEYGNGVTTGYHYYQDTFRLHKLFTRRENGPWLQNLHYTYDPAGNITHIQDDAQQTIFFKNQQVDPNADYTYDAIYRLIEATGREHLGQKPDGNREPIPIGHDDSLRMNRPHPNDEKAMGRYRQEYLYDEVGNFLEMIHKVTDPAHSGWTRAYDYKEASLLEAGKTSNRLSSTTVGQRKEVYTHDAHGNMTSIPHLTEMAWDFQDQLQKTAKQVVNNGGTSETTYYVYDIDGQRVRKVTEQQNGTRLKERIYLDGFEIYRKYESDGQTVKLERETLHVMDDEQRIALVETRTKGNDNSPEKLIRYQLGNHLGSVSLELDRQGKVISYEEYYPYGSTSYQSCRSVAEVSQKQYSYTGKERDNENNLHYYGARYCASWLGRWTSCDPAGLVDGLNTYVFSLNRVTVTKDTHGMKTYILTYTPGVTLKEGVTKGAVYKKAAYTRKKEIESSEGFNPDVDHVFVLEIKNLGHLKNQIQKIVKKSKEKGYGRTVEFSFWGHGGVDGPQGLWEGEGQSTPTYHDLETTDEERRRIAARNMEYQLLPRRWSQIDFNWDEKSSIASFYHCKSSTFAKKFLKYQPKVAATVGGEGTSYPSVSGRRRVIRNDSWWSEVKADWKWGGTGNDEPWKNQDSIYFVFTDRLLFDSEEKTLRLFQRNGKIRKIFANASPLSKVPKNKKRHLEENKKTAPQKKQKLIPQKNMTPEPELDWEVKYMRFGARIF